MSSRNLSSGITKEAIILLVIVVFIHILCFFVPSCSRKDHEIYSGGYAKFLVLEKAEYKGISGRVYQASVYFLSSGNKVKLDLDSSTWGSLKQGDTTTALYIEKMNF